MNWPWGKYWFATFMREPGEPWMDRFNRSAIARLGVMIFNVVGGTIIFIATNAGLKIVGL